MTAALAAELREERERYAEKHERFDKDMTKALWEIEQVAFLRQRPPAARYVLAEYKRGVK